MNIPQKFHGIMSESIDIHKRAKPDTDVDFPKSVREMSTAANLKIGWESTDGPKDGYISTIMKKIFLNEANVPVRPFYMSVEEPIFHQLRTVANPSQTYNLLSRRFREKAILVDLKT